MSGVASWNDICRGVIGDGRKGVRAVWDRLEVSTIVVVLEVGLSRMLARYVSSLVICCGDWLSAN
jgi:hypothetical protein